MKELGVVKEWLRSMESRGEAAYSNPISFPDDPPDCVVRDRAGEVAVLFSYEPGVGSPYIKLPLNRP